jgi:c-di-GMP-related signal transduction protein
MYVARQPIVDRAGNIAAYELLFRGDMTRPMDGFHATASVIAKAFADPGFADLLGPYRGFVNVDASFIESDLIELLPPARTVVEVLENTEFTPSILARLRDLKAGGYVIASDDFDGNFESIAPALELIDIVKVDLRLTEGSDPADIRRRIPGKSLLAEKVETREEHQDYLKAGYNLFQGYYFAKPERAGDIRPDPDRIAALRLLTLLGQDASDNVLDAEIKRHPNLGLGLLRLVNAAASGLAQPISSMRQALMHLGRRQILRWVQLIVYLGGKGGDPDANPLLQLAVVRARTMELLAQAIGRSGERAFLVGMVSLFDVATGLSSAEIANRLGLDQEIRGALLERSGEVGALFEIALALEQGDTAAVEAARGGIPRLTMEQVENASRQALIWAGSKAKN